MTRKIQLAILLAFVIIFSFAGLVQRQKNTPVQVLKKSSVSSIVDRSPYDLLTFPTITYHLATVTITSSLEVAFDDVLVFTPTNSTRAMIYDFIKDNPGVQFRGICNELGLAIGLAEFHLGVLKKAGLISSIRDGRYKRFFEAKRFSLKEMQLISLLRHKTVSNILRSILTTKTMSHSELAYQLSITSQGLTWQMNQLKKAGVVQQSSEGIKAFYTLEETCAPILTEIMSLVEKP